jgi:hypothetical protein
MWLCVAWIVLIYEERLHRWLSGRISTFKQTILVFAADGNVKNDKKDRLALNPAWHWAVIYMAPTSSFP